MKKGTRKPVDPAGIDLQGKRKDALLLERHAAEAGAAALPFLEKAFVEGSGQIRAMATKAIVALEPARAERLVLGLVRSLGKKASKTQRATAHGLLLTAGTPRAVAAFFDAGETMDGIPSAHIQPVVFAHVVERAPAASPAELRVLLRASGLLHDTAILEALDAVRITVDVELALEASRFATPKARLAALARYIEDAVSRQEIAKTLGAHDDRAWIELLAPYRAERGVFLVLIALQEPRALEALRATADRDAFDDATKEACYLLGVAGDQVAPPILLRWLGDPAANDAVPMLLTALAACGDERTAVALVAVRPRHPTRSGFFAHAIQSIRARADAAIAAESSKLG